MSIGKDLASTEAVPFWIGIAVTFITAITAALILFRLKRSSLGRNLDDVTLEQLMQRMTRDIDTVQSAASVIAVIASALLLVHLTSAEGAIAFLFALALIVVILFVLLVVSPADYSHFTKGPFTPLAILLLTLNGLGLLLVVVLA